MSQWLNKKTHKDHTAVAHTNGRAFTFNPDEKIDLVLITNSPSKQIPLDVQQYFDSFVGQSAQSWMK
jgi:hypothetical protein